MADLFDRAVAVTVAKPTGFFDEGVNAVVVQNLRVQFDVEKHLGAEPNTCQVAIDNLAEQTRGLFQTKPLRVRLEAGFGGQVQRLFAGDLRWGASKRDGANWRTELELGDGERAYKHARVRRSYRAGVDVRTALNETAKSMDLTLPAEAAGLRELAGQFASGLSIAGSSSAQLSRLLAPFGLTWSVQDGRLQILSADGTRPGEALLISQDTGMIGSPEYGPPAVPPRVASTDREPSDTPRAPSASKIRRDSRKPVLTVRTLLYPSATPGGRIKVESQAINGLFKVLRVRHHGDTHGADWETEIEALPL